MSLIRPGPKGPSPPQFAPPGRAMVKQGVMKTPSRPVSHDRTAIGASQGSGTTPRLGRWRFFLQFMIQVFWQRKDSMIIEISQWPMIPNIYPNTILGLKFSESVDCKTQNIKQRLLMLLLLAWVVGVIGVGSWGPLLHWMEGHHLRQDLAVILVIWSGRC